MTFEQFRKALLDSGWLSIVITMDKYGENRKEVFRQGDFVYKPEIALKKAQEWLIENNIY